MLPSRFSAVLVCLTVWAQARPLTTSVRLGSSLAIDGALDESAWKKAVICAEFRTFKAEEMAGRRTSFLYRGQIL